MTTALPQPLLAALRDDFRCHDYAGAADPDALLAAVGSRIRGVVQGGWIATSPALLDRLPALELISVFGVGYDGVPVDYCRGRGVRVTNTPDVLTEDVADVALALILMTVREFVRLDRFVRDGRWLAGGPWLTTRLAGRTVGILGLGRIGTAIAHRVEVLGTKVAWTGRTPRDVTWRYVPDLALLARESDVLVVACPGGPATRHLVDARVLEALGPEGTLVNIARGSIVDEEALVRALTDGTIKGAGLDVYADEPRVPPAMLAMDNVVLLPHVGSATRETRQAMADLCKANLDAWFDGGNVLTLVPELR
ncbi:MAG TPA: 2-hydroxyacid dehydrogenase [Casimicrobiaceae bacterium]